MTKGFKALIGRAMLAMALCAAAAPVVAQDTATASPPPAETIGPRELSDFTLNGTVTRRAAPPVEAPAQQQANPPQTTAESPTAAVTSRRTAPAEARPEAARDRPAAADILSRPPTLPEPTRRSATDARPAPVPAFSGLDTDAPVGAESGFSPLPWIAALLLLGAGAAIYFGRQGRGQGYAAAGPALARDLAPVPQPEPQPIPRPAARPDRKPPTTLIPKQASPATDGPATIVSTSLRPWLEIELKPIQAALDDEKAALAFEVTLFNSGSAPARDVAVEACLLNAGARQDERLAEFFTMPGKVKDTIPIIAPLSRVALKSAVRLRREAVVEYEVEGRKLFMPLVAINSRYRWSSGEGQSAGGFLVGRGADGQDKLGPLRSDQGPRAWKDLSVRRYEKGLRR